MARLSEITIVIRMSPPVAIEDHWPDTVQSLLTNIGHPCGDGTEVIAFAHGNALTTTKEKDNGAT